MTNRPEIHVSIEIAPYEAAVYALRVLLADLDARVVFHRSAADLPDGALRIRYGVGPLRPGRGPELLLHACSRFWENYGRESSLPALPLTRVPLGDLGFPPTDRVGSPMPLPYVSEQAPPSAQFLRSESGAGRASLSTGADLVASAFFWITRYQESLIRERDEEGRIPQTQLLELREDLTERALVDEYAAVLGAWIGKLDSSAVARSRDFRIFLTHDVDTGIGVRGLWKNAENAARTMYREVVRSRRPATGLHGAAEWTLRGIGVREEPAVFRDIAAVDRGLGFPSFFFLMANGSHPKDATYDILGPDARRVIGAIRECGGAIGLHIGLNAHRSLDQFRSEWDRLREAAGSDVWPACRSHFLSFFPPTTWRQLVELGFRVDSTLGYSDHVGFRGGTCRGFRPFDVERLEVLPMWELPMTVMDVNLFREIRADGERVAQIRGVARRVRAHGGCLVVNWHNVSFHGHYRRVYREALRDLSEARAVRLDDVPVGEDAVVW